MIYMYPVLLLQRPLEVVLSLRKVRLPLILPKMPDTPEILGGDWFFVFFLKKIRLSHIRTHCILLLVSALNSHPYSFIFHLSLLISLTNLFKIFHLFSNWQILWRHLLVWCQRCWPPELQPSFSFFQICNALILRWSSPLLPESDLPKKFQLYIWHR